MKREFLHITTGELINIVRIKIGEYDQDFHKLVDTYGREWLPEQLISFSANNRESILKATDERNHSRFDYFSDKRVGKSSLYRTLIPN